MPIPAPVDKNFERSADRSFETDPRWKLAERIVATPGFAKSARLSTFLLHIVRQTVCGHPEVLSEQLIGESIFGRPVGYDPRDDNIVRSHASRLRQRLELYFLEEGRGETLQIRIPRGTYVPSFDRVQNKVAETSLPDTTPARRNFWVAGAAVGLVLALFLVSFALHRRHVAQSASPTHQLWSGLFNGNRETLIVPADSSLVVLQVFTGHAVSVSEYASGRYLTDIVCNKPCDKTLLETLAAHRYTSTADLQFAVAITHVPEALQNRTEVRYARDLQLDDLKRSNLVLIGAPDANPWATLFLPSLNFILQADRTKGPLEIENRKPAAGEPSRYPYDLQNPSHGYASIAYLPNLSGEGNVLIVQGFSLADTQAAAEFVTNRKAFDALFSTVARNASPLPHFELLLRTLDVNGLGSPPSLVAYRIYR
jgi:hypothetical protein